MAQYFTDFSEYSTGSFPQSGDDWTERWLSDRWDTQSGTGGTGKDLVGEPDFFGDRGGITWDSKDSSDVEVAVRFTTVPSSESNDNFYVPMVRAGGTSGSEDAVQYVLRVGNTSWIRVTSGGSSSFPATGGSQLAHGTEYWARFRVNGDSLSGKFWEVANSEPSSWDLTATDSTLTSGWTGLWLDTSAAELSTHHEMGVGTAGDTAPLSEPVQAPAAPTNLQLSEQ